MIPVLVIPILNGPDLLHELLASINQPVGKVIVIDNSPDGLEINSPIPNTVVIGARHNLGVAASWNLGIKLSPLASWWMFSNHDLTFGEGDLARLTEHMETVGGVALLGTFQAFGVSAEALNQVGWFDENFIPAYFEDNDFDYRCRLAGISLVGLPAAITHRISSTIRSDSRYQTQNDRTFPRNERYFFQKWGGDKYAEVYPTPFDQGGDFRDWRLDISYLRDMTWTPDAS